MAWSVAAGCACLQVCCPSARVAARLDTFMHVAELMMIIGAKEQAQSVLERMSE